MDGSAAPEQSSASSWLTRLRWVPTSVPEALSAEKKLLSCLKSPWQVKDVVVGNQKGHYMHTIEVGSHNSIPVVMLSGYAAGSAFWWRNLDPIAEHCHVYAVDWLGTGLSGRPSFQAQSTQEAEDFFLKPLDEWRKSMGLDRFILVGHSLGGYLAAAYALRHPEQVMHLVLVAPAGMPRRPEDWPPAKYANSMLWRVLWRSVDWAWSSGVTPGAAIRTFGPWGSRWVGNYVNQRWSSKRGILMEDEPLFRDYLYHIMALPGSGEFALRHLLQPGAWAHNPLEERLHALQPPITAIYGAGDWMDPKAGQRIVADLARDRVPKNDQDLRVEIIDDAGHFPMFEQVEAFNRALLNIIRPYLGGSPPPSTPGVRAAMHSMTHSTGTAAGSVAATLVSASLLASPAEQRAAMHTAGLSAEPTTADRAMPTKAEAQQGTDSADIALSCSA